MTQLPGVPAPATKPQREAGASPSNVVHAGPTSVPQPANSSPKSDAATSVGILVEGQYLSVFIIGLNEVVAALRAGSKEVTVCKVSLVNGKHAAVGKAGGML